MRSKNTLPYPVRSAVFAALVFGALAVAFSALAAPQHEAEGSSPGTAAEATRTVFVTAKDNRFDPQQINVRESETVRFVVTNAGAMIHEFTIGTATAQRSHRRMMT